MKGVGRFILFWLIAVNCRAQGVHLIPDSLPAEDDPVEFWIGLELGYGVASPLCAACGENGPQHGTTGNVFVGFGVSKTFFLGVQGSVWISDWGVYNNRTDKIYRTHFLLISSYYPWTNSGFFGKAGLGFSVFNAYDRFEPRVLDSYGKYLPSDVHGHGPGVLIGAGYDFQLSERLSLSPAFTYTFGYLGTLVLNETRDLPGKKTLNLVEFHLGLSFHSEGR